MALADVLVMPDLRGFASLDYERYRELIELGYRAAEKKSEQLLRYRVADAEWQSYLATRSARRKRRPERVEFVELSGADEHFRPLIERETARLGPLAADPQTIESKLSQATESGRFASADYFFLQRGAQDGLGVRLHEKQHAPPLLDLGILISANDRDGAKFGVGARVTFLDLGGPLSELRLDGNIGGINQGSVEYYWRPGSGMFFFAPGFSYRTDTLPYYNGDFETGRFSALEARGGADLGLALGRKTEWRVGYAMEHSSFRASSGSPPIESFAGRWSILRTRFVHDTQDAAVIASRGFRTEFATDYSITAPLGMRTGVVRLESQNLWTRTLGPHYRLMTRMNGGWTSKDDFLVRPFTLGGEAGLVALARYQMLGNRYYYGSAMFMRSITKGNKPLYAVFQWEAGRAGLKGTMRPYQDGALGFVSETALGVLFCGYAMGEQGERRLFFHLGLLN
jgi:NTE family protein